jgi:hypothetical protein
MDHSNIIENLNSNTGVFEGLLKNKSESEYRWRPSENKWCLLEIVCHLYDEECEDFRGRVRHTLEKPNEPLPMFDQVAWVTERNYFGQNYTEKVSQFLEERRSSINWLKSIKNPSWKNAYNHPKLGPLSAEHFLANWLAHDYLHLRQILRLQFQYLSVRTNDELTYAGTW